MQRTTEMRLAINRPMELIVAGEVQLINMTPLKAKDFEELVMQNLSALARESFRTARQHCTGSIFRSGRPHIKAFCAFGESAVRLTY